MENEQLSVANENVEVQNDSSLSENDKAKKVSDFTINLKSSIKKFANPKFSTSYIAKIAILTAISFILYAFVKFSLPFMFPSFLDMQISELPALLAGFSMGPVSGCLVIVLKCLLKFPMSGTGYVGELTDMLIGIALVLPASIIYSIKKDKKHAFIGLSAGSLIFVSTALIVNRFISIPFYANLYGMDNVVRMMSALYKNLSAQNIYAYYLPLAVLPFNLIRCIIMSALTFVLYKRLSVLLHWEGKSLRKDSIFGKHKVKTVEDTYVLARKIAITLVGGEVLILNGDLGAGKTTFTKGLAEALGVKEEVTSPTFTILNVYESGSIKLNHLDMYRVDSSDELAELGIEDCFDEEAVTVIEWNKFQHLDGKVIEISIVQNDSERIFEISKRENAVDGADKEENKLTDIIDEADSGAETEKEIKELNTEE